MPNKDNNTKVCCSFCGKTQDEAVRLIEGPGVYICDSCISFCNSLLMGDQEFSGKRASKRKKEKDRDNQ